MRCLLLGVLILGVGCAEAGPRAGSIAEFGQAPPEYWAEVAYRCQRGENTSVYQGNLCP